MSVTRFLSSYKPWNLTHPLWIPAILMTPQPQLKQCVSGGVELVITTQSLPTDHTPTNYSPSALPETPEPTTVIV